MKRLWQAQSRIFCYMSDCILSPKRLRVRVGSVCGCGWRCVTRFFVGGGRWMGWRFQSLSLSVSKDSFRLWPPIEWQGRGKFFSYFQNDKGFYYSHLQELAGSAGSGMETNRQKFKNHFMSSEPHYFFFLEKNKYLKIYVCRYFNLALNILQFQLLFLMSFHG